jgi:hypothetical protein
MVQVKDNQHAGPEGEGGIQRADFTITTPAPVPPSVVSEYLANVRILEKAEEEIPLFTYEEFLNELKNEKIDTIDFEAIDYRNPLGDATMGWCIGEKSDHNKSLLYKFPYCINIQKSGIKDNSEYTINLYLDDNYNPQYVTYTKTNLSTKICTEVSKIPQDRAISAINKLSPIS